MTFEAIFGYRNGEIWHACFEVADESLQAFVPFTKITTLSEPIYDLLIVRKHAVFVATANKVYQYLLKTTL
jgi:hypothetical protein